MAIASFCAIALMRIISDRGPFEAPDGLPDRPGRKVKGLAFRCFLQGPQASPFARLGVKTSQGKPASAHPSLFGHHLPHGRRLWTYAVELRHR